MPVWFRARTMQLVYGRSNLNNPKRPPKDGLFKDVFEEKKIRGEEPSQSFVKKYKQEKGEII